MILHPTKTVAGRQATFNASQTGLALTLTHISIGDSGGPIDDRRTSLRHERERVAVYGQRVNDSQIRLDAVFAGPESFWVREVGIWAGNTLVYYWSTEGAELGHKSPQFEWLLGLDLALDEAVDGQLQVTSQAPNLDLHLSSHLAVVLRALCDTNRLVLQPYAS
ncbi:phage tail protein [Herbaspirillum seropedicae]|uniref:Tail related protein n=1 Tax=Herbaspirillum seropedicae (strain SmR1) TaxID=757424 RepID=D8IV16_HERSS|nr:phage tail protein [Herbaspirillum seropedicae]ADJ61735.1 tail related protein [Herbaspirillum seropedicae SmR1]AKN63939.1 tail-like protein [Herbaspirillum seropedicae]NQE29310.1 tail-like protein [Herbaspirillum seropedicae]UMU19849.1 phage tail protein [Herbaspirillum seropedicae]